MGDPITIVNLPTEIQLTILTLLDIQSLLAIRQTCKNICQATHEKIIWLSLLDKQRQYLPVPHDLNDPHPDHSSSFIESIVRQVQVTANGWPRPRIVPWKLERKELGSTLMGVEMFLDRWLIVIYSEGVIYLYDTQPINPQGEKSRQAAVILRSCLDLKSVWASYTISFDSTANKLVLAIARPYLVHIYKVHLTELSLNNDMVPDAFNIIRVITLPPHQIVRALNTTERIVALSSSNTVGLVKWDEDSITEEKVLLALHPEDMWNGIIDIHFMGPYILIFRTRSLELRHFISLFRPNPSEPSTWPSLKHPFSMTFRDVSFSNCSHSRNRISGTDTYTTTLFAHDVLKGLFQYIVQLTLSSELSTFPPSLQVTLMSIYPLITTYSDAIPSTETATTSLTNPTLTYSANFSSPVDQTHFLGLHPSRNASDGHSRGFVSAHAMGPQGKRAIWIERKRSSTMREVQVWSKELSLADGSDSICDHGASNPTEIQQRVVYSVNSFDLRDDITRCTFGELTGKIVLGSRSGDISILDLDI